MKRDVWYRRCGAGKTRNGVVGFMTLILALPLFGALVMNDASAARENPKNGPILVRLRIEAKPAPTNAVGILLSSDGAKQITETKIDKISDRLYDVSFQVERRLVQEDSVATAMAVSAMGDVSFANVTPVSVEDGGDQLGSIPDCEPEDPTRIATLDQVPLVQKLVGLRKERAALAKRKVTLALDVETVAKIQKFEAALGLSSVEPISAELPPAELVERLSRLNFAIKRYKSFKTRATAPSNGNAE